MKPSIVIKIGDWVRFRRGGALVVGVVTYITQKASWDSTPKYVTDIGDVLAEDVLELRATPESRQP